MMAGMTVKQLKKSLRGVPDDAEVLLVDHDHSENEYNGVARFCGHETGGGERYEALRNEEGGAADIFWIQV